MIYLLFALLPLWAIIRAFQRGSYDTVFFGRYSRAEKPADFWFFITGAAVILIGAVIAGLRTF